MNDYWTNNENSLHRLYGDGSEERCDYAGISMLTVGAGEEAARRPCSYCGEGIEPGQFKCEGCGHAEWAIVTACQIRLEARLPQGGRLLDLNKRSILEVRRKDWYSLPDTPYFMDGGHSIRSAGSRYAVWAPGPVGMYASAPAPEPELEPEPEKPKDPVIIRLTDFSLINTVIDRPVPLSSSDTDWMYVSMMLECEAEFLFGSREE
jgi:hypothetical protein